MGKCPGCGFPIPFKTCPHCPPTPFLCPRCGVESVAPRMAAEEFDELVESREEKRDPVVVNLGDFKHNE